LSSRVADSRFIVFWLCEGRLLISGFEARWSARPNNPQVNRVFEALVY
jgi:hypothetical protein